MKKNEFEKIFGEVGEPKTGWEIVKEMTIKEEIKMLSSWGLGEWLVVITAAIPTILFLINVIYFFGEW